MEDKNKKYSASAAAMKEFIKYKSSPMSWIDPSIRTFDHPGISNAKNYNDFARRFMLSVWKNIFGYRRFFMKDWWKLKFRKINQEVNK